MKLSQKAAAFSASFRNRLRVQDESRLYVILQLVFTLTNLLLAYVTVAQTNLRSTGVWIFVIYGVLLAVAAGKGWNARICRIATRVLMLIVSLGFLAVVICEVATTQIMEPVGGTYVVRSFGDYMGQFAADACLYVQGIVLATAPALVLAARKNKGRLDVVLLYIDAVLAAVLAAVTLFLALESPQRLDYSAELLFFSNAVLRGMYLISTIALVCAVYVSHPFLKKRKKA